MNRLLLLVVVTVIATCAQAQTCDFEGKSYREGESFSPLDCTRCVCQGNPLQFACSTDPACEDTPTPEVAVDVTTSAPTSAPTAPSIGIHVCSKFRDLNNGDVEYDSDAEDAETFQPGTVADFYCHIEHELFGPESAVCLDNGQWNNELPECLPFRQCPQLGHPRFGWVVNRQPGYQPGDKAMFKCKKNYKNTGSSYRVCQENLKWSAEGPTCVKANKGPGGRQKLCGDPGDIENGRKTGRDYAVGSTVAYACHQGYFLRGSSQIECRSSGLWSSPPPSCEIVRDSLDTLAGRFANATDNYGQRSDCKIDLVFVLDKSGSVSNEDFRLSVQFVRETVTTFTSKCDDVRFALITYSKHAELNANFEYASQLTEVLRHVRRGTYGPTATRRGLDKVRDDLLLNNRHCYACLPPTERPEEKDFFTYPCPSCTNECPVRDQRCSHCASTLLFLVTDGKSNWAGDPVHAANCVKASGVEIFSVGVTSHVNLAELRDIASKPFYSHLYLIRSYEDALQLIRGAAKRFK